MSAATCIGLRDKLYWRQIDGRFHCFKRVGGDATMLLGYRRGARIWGSLCCRHIIRRCGGQATERPRPELRCGLCDGREMERRGWDESGPTTLNQPPEVAESRGSR